MWILCNANLHHRGYQITQGAYKLGHFPSSNTHAHSMHFMDFLYKILLMHALNIPLSCRINSECIHDRVSPQSAMFFRGSNINGSSLYHKTQFQWRGRGGTGQLTNRLKWTCLNINTCMCLNCALALAIYIFVVLIFMLWHRERLISHKESELSRVLRCVIG